jgi:conjugal transfer pilus assembly protein TraK
MYPSFGNQRPGSVWRWRCCSLASPPRAWPRSSWKATPDDGLTATVSRTEPNLIRVDGRKIRRIQGVEGEFAVSADRETGAAYLKPTTDQAQLSVFVADDAGRHWKLLLKVADVPAETLVMRDRGRPGEGRAHSSPTSSRHAAIRRVLLALARDTDAGRHDRQRAAGDRPALERSRLFWCGRWKAFLFGEKYQLTNVSSSRMVIDERELYRQGVLAVMVDSLELEPGEATQVMVVLEGRDG